MLTCTVKLEFNAAKRLVEFEGKCHQLHGYRYTLEASFTAPKNKNGLVIDFYELKQKLGAWIEKNWEHNVVLNVKDKPLGNAIGDLTGQTIFYMKNDPTAENMAEYLKDTVCPKLFGKTVKCTRIRLYDTPDAWVEVTD